MTRRPATPARGLHRGRGHRALRGFTLAGLAAGTLGLGFGTPAAQAARTNDLAKPVLLLAGPEVAGDPCVAMQPIRTAIQKYTPTVGGQKLRFTGDFEVLALSPGKECARKESTTARSANLAEAAMVVARHIEMMNSASGPIDVVAAGSGGLALRYALLMSARNRAGLTAFGAGGFPKSLAVEDAIAIGAPMDGNPAPGSSCGAAPAQYCADLKKDDEHPATHWQLLTSEAAGGLAPQGVGGTDWSVIALAGDRFAPVSSATAMSPSHRTIYTDDALNLAKGLADTSEKRDAKLRYAHGADAEYTAATKGVHVAQRVAQDVVFGTSVDAPGEGPAYAPGCTGSNDDASGETVIQDPQLLGWSGDKRAVRRLKFGNVDAIADCFKAEGDPKDGIYKVEGPATVRINGLDYELQRSFVKLFVNTKTRRVWSRGGEVWVSLPVSEKGGLHLWSFSDDSRKKLDWKYPADGGAIQSEDGTLFAKETEAKLFGAGVKGAVSLSIGKGSTQLALSVELPGIFSSRLTGTSMVQCSDGIDNDKDKKTDAEDDACTVPWGDFEDRSQATGVGMTLATTNKSGLQIEKANGKVGGALRFGPFRSEGSVSVEWSRADAEWKVEMEAKLPAVSSIGVKLKLGFKDGQLSSIYGEANSLNIPLGVVRVLPPAVRPRSERLPRRDEADRADDRARGVVLPQDRRDDGAHVGRRPDRRLGRAVEVQARGVDVRRRSADRLRLGRVRGWLRRQAEREARPEDQLQRGGARAHPDGHARRAGEQLRRVRHGQPAAVLHQGQGDVEDLRGAVVRSEVRDADHPLQGAARHPGVLHALGRADARRRARGLRGPVLVRRVAAEHAVAGELRLDRGRLRRGGLRRQGERSAGGAAGGWGVRVGAAARRRRERLRHRARCVGEGGDGARPGWSGAAGHARGAGRPAVRDARRPDGRRVGGRDGPHGPGRHDGVRARPAGGGPLAGRHRGGVAGAGGRRSARRAAAAEGHCSRAPWAPWRLGAADVRRAAAGAGGAVRRARRSGVA
ncbi:MAG: hypothetical protein PGN13_15410 [Patulibacter minatonensis]